jgi:nucleotide-binding universal stress UspA family protein
MAAKALMLDELITDADRLAAGGACTVLEVSDSTAQTIADYATTHAIDLIVMGTDARTGMSQLLLGSVTERVVRIAPCPVLTVRYPEHEFVLPSHQNSEAAMILLKTILVATDFSDASDAALAYGRELARNFGANLVVLHVVDNVVAYGVGDGVVIMQPELQRQIEANARQRLDNLLSNEDREQLGASTVILVSNATSPAITDYANEAKVDLIVIGTHGRRAVAHLLIGSVAERVVSTAPCPVLTVRHPEREFVLPDALVAVARA